MGGPSLRKFERGPFGILEGGCGLGEVASRSMAALSRERLRDSGLLVTIGLVEVVEAVPGVLGEFCEAGEAGVGWEVDGFPIEAASSSLVRSMGCDGTPGLETGVV